MLREKTAAFLSLGCKVNSYETEALRSMFEKAGYKIVDFKDIADVYVVNTCTVTNIADRKSRQMLHKARRQNEKAVIAAVGCYVQTAKEKLIDDGSVDIVVGNNNKTKLLKLVEQYIKAGKDKEAGEGSGKNRVILKDDKYSDTREIEEAGKDRDTVKRLAAGKPIEACEVSSDREAIETGEAGADKKGRVFVSDISYQKLYEDMNISSVMERTRAFIKIQDGCNRFCSYCIIPYVRGRVRSRNEEDILSEIARLTEKGYKEFVLTGIHISSYGMERKSDADQSGIHNPLAALIGRIGRLPGIERIRVGSLEPGIITEDFVQAVSKVRQFCPHFHLSLQSGCDTVLVRMNRQYTSGEYCDKVRLIRGYYENPAFTTDIIVGFPGETADEFDETVRFVEKIGFSRVHVFKYSKREGTKAAAMPGQITEKIKHERSSRLIAVSDRVAAEYKEFFMGRIEKILVEEEFTLNNARYQLGHNERYLKLAIQCDTDLTNRLLDVRVTGRLNEDIMICEIIH